jgi:hypothetical protein
MGRIKLKDCFLEDGAPKYLRCYEAKRGGCVDRFTFVFTYASRRLGPQWAGRVLFIAAGKDPEAFYQHGDSCRGSFCPSGSPVKWQDVNKKLQSWILDEYNDIWRDGEDGE